MPISVRATVPGQVHLDLLDSGVLSQDPLYRQNELEYAWVGQSCWAYESEQFHLKDFDPNSQTPIFLRLDGVDTSASIYLNWHLIGSTQNAYRQHTIEIDRSLLNN
jgi:beta-mannosidase